MSWIKTFKNKSGGYDSFDWSISTALKVHFGSILLIVLGMSFFCTIGPIVCVIMYPWPGTRSSSKGLVFGAMIMSLAWVLDYQFGLFNWFIWHAFPNAYFTITVINVTILIFATIIFMFESYIWKMLVNSGYPFLITYIFSSFLIYKLYPIIGDLVSNILTLSSTPIW